MPHDRLGLVHGREVAFPLLRSLDVSRGERSVSVFRRSRQFQIPKLKVPIKAKKQRPKCYHWNIGISFGLGVLTIGLLLGGILVRASLDNFG